MSGQDKKINVVRLGRSEKINPQVVEVTLEELVSARLNKAAGYSENQRQETQKLMQDHKEISRKLNEMYDKRDEMEKNNQSITELMSDLNGLRTEKNSFTSTIE